MIYRKVAKFTAAACVAILSVGASGTSVFAQQSFGVGSTSCASCSQGISFPSSNVSSMPFTTSQVIYPAGQIAYSSPTIPLPSTSSFSNSSFVNSTVSNTYYPSQVNGTVETYPTATYASGSQNVGGVVISEPVGTVTSMPATSIAPAAAYVQPTATYAQPVATYVQPTPSYVQPATIAQPAYYQPTRSTPIRSTLSTGYHTVSSGLSNVSTGLAQRKAQQAASGSVRGHIGGSLGGARYEGVGWSNRSPQAAIEQCCYWGTRPTAQIGVSRSSDGYWYACVLYN